MKRLFVWSILAASVGVITHLTASTFVDTGATATFTLQEGKEVDFVLFVSPTCSSCNDPKFRPAWMRIVQEAKAWSARTGTPVHFTGVAVSSSPEAGLAFLDRLGPFHEVAAGRAWRNLVVMKYTAELQYARPAVPQILVIERDVDLRSRGEVVFRSEKARERRVGLEAILDWRGLTNSILSVSPKD
jgi:hypothetical protein